MIFLVLVGAISFCVFMAMCAENMLIKMHKKMKQLLIACLVVVGIVAQNIPQLSTIVVICLSGLAAAVLISVAYKSILKGIVFAAYVTALLFGMQGLTLLLSRLLDIHSVLLVILHAAIVIVVFLNAYLLTKFFARRAYSNILNHQTMRFLLVGAGVVLVFIFKSNAIGDAYISLGGRTVNFGDIAFMLFFASGVVMFSIVARYISKETALRTERLLVESSKKYIQDLEESYKVLRTIKHDYVNILTSFKLYIDNKDMDGLTKYYYNELSEINKDLLNQDKRMGSLQNIHISEVKSIIIYKTASMHSGIDIRIEASDLIETLGVSSAIVCQMLAIFLDNAAEALLEPDNKKLNIAIVKNRTSKTFIIKNTWKQQDVPINKFFELGFSTKAEGRGIGLYTARSYTEKIKGLHLETEISEEFFTQILTVEDA